jgi:hypothetical protein
MKPPGSVTDPAVRAGREPAGSAFLRRHTAKCPRGQGEHVEERAAEHAPDESAQRQSPLLRQSGVTREPRTRHLQTARNREAGKGAGGPDCQRQTLPAIWGVRDRLAPGVAAAL